MANLGSKEKPIIVRVATPAQGQAVAAQCAEHGWYYSVGLEPDKPVDLSDLERSLNPPEPFHATKIGHNDPCSCGSGHEV